MMKCVFALVLLHLCHSATLGLDLYSEMIGNLNELTKFRRVNKVIFTSPENVTAPTTEMTENAASCIGVFRRNLRHLLNSVTVHKDVENTVKKLQGNLGALGQHAESNPNCPMRDKQRNQTVFQKYTKFLKRLNSRG